MATPSQGFSLDAKFTQESGRIYLSGTQALVRLPLDQHRADKRRGLRTATFISGYRGSPLGGLDQTLERERKLLESPPRGVLVGAQRGPRCHRGVRQPDGGALPAPEVRRRARACGTARRPAWTGRAMPSSTRTTRDRARTAACSPWWATTRVEVVDDAQPLGVAFYDALMPHDLSPATSRRSSTWACTVSCSLGAPDCGRHEDRPPQSPTRSGSAEVSPIG